MKLASHLIDLIEAKKMSGELKEINLEFIEEQIYHMSKTNFVLSISCLIKMLL